MPAAPENIAASPLAGCLTDLDLDHPASRGEARLCCSADFPGFAGHFPGLPVLPAVIQLLAARLLTEAVAGEQIQPLRLERLKFKGMISPGERVRVRVNLKPHPEGLAAEFTLDRQGAAIASGTMVFRPRAAEV